MEEFIPNISEIIERVGGGVCWIMPELVLCLAFLISIFTGIFKKPLLTYGVVVLGIVAAAFLSISQLQYPSTDAVFFDMIKPDRQSAGLKLIISFVYLLFVVFIKYHKTLRSHQKGLDDLLSVTLAIHIGLNLLVMAVNWLMVYIAIELVSVGSYILVAYLGEKKEPAEAALKYVLFGTVCSAVMLYGLSLLYGFTGSLSFMDPAHFTHFSQMPKVTFLLITLFILTGIGFKLAFAPFHFWTPDVYEGAPTPITAFLTTAPKIAAVGFLGRLLFSWSTQTHGLPVMLLYLLMGFGVASMLVGNLAALRQRAVKRLMAYSAIGHTGFLLMIALTDLNQTFPVLYFYLVIYALMNMGVFMLIGFFEEELAISFVDQYSGLGRVYPILMTAMAVLMVSLTGLPPTAGFVAKLLAFSSVLSVYQETANVGWLLLLATGALTTVVSLFFYLKIPFHAFLRQGERVSPKSRPNFLIALAVFLALLTVLLGIFPSIVLGWVS